jgi:hypothetical protein
MATFQAPRLDAEITTRNLSSSGAALNILLKDNFSMLRSLSSSGLRTNNYSTWLIWLSYPGGYTLQEYSDDGFREH